MSLIMVSVGFVFISIIYMHHSPVLVIKIPPKHVSPCCVCVDQGGCVCVCAFYIHIKQQNMHLKMHFHNMEIHYVGFHSMSSPSESIWFDLQGFAVMEFTHKTQSPSFL